MEGIKWQAKSRDEADDGKTHLALGRDWLEVHFLKNGRHRVQEQTKWE